MPRSSSPYGHPWPRVRLEILHRDGWVCRVLGPTCKGHATTVDHIVPLSRGGARLDPANLRAACASCQTWCTQETRRLRQTAQRPGQDPYYGPDGVRRPRYGTPAEP